MMFASEDQVDSTPRKKAKLKYYKRPPFHGIKKGAYDDFVIIRHAHQPACLYPARPLHMKSDRMIDARTTLASTTRYASGDQANETSEEKDKSAHAANSFDVGNPSYKGYTQIQYQIMRARKKFLKKLKKKKATASNSTMVRRRMTPSQLSTDTRAREFTSSSSENEKGDIDKTDSDIDELNTVAKAVNLLTRIKKHSLTMPTLAEDTQARESPLNSSDPNYATSNRDVRSAHDGGVDNRTDSPSPKKRRLSNNVKHRGDSARHSFRGDQLQPSDAVTRTKEHFGSNIRIKPQELTANVSDVVSKQGTSAGYVHQLARKSERDSVTLRRLSKRDHQVKHESLSNRVKSSPVSAFHKFNRHHSLDEAKAVKADDDDMDNVASTASHYMSARSQAPISQYDYVGLSHHGHKSGGSGGRMPMKAAFEEEGGRPPKNSKDYGDDGERVKQNMNMWRYVAGGPLNNEDTGGEKSQRNKPPTNNKDYGDNGERVKQNMNMWRYVAGGPLHDEDTDELKSQSNKTPEKYASAMTRSQQLIPDENSRNNSTTGKRMLIGIGPTPEANDREVSARALNDRSYEQRYSAKTSKLFKPEARFAKYDTGPTHRDRGLDIEAYKYRDSTSRSRDTEYTLQRECCFSDSSYEAQCKGAKDVSPACGRLRRRQNNLFASLSGSPLYSESSVKTDCQHNPNARRTRIAVLLIMYLIFCLIMWRVFLGSTNNETPKQKASQGFIQQKQDHLFHHALEKGVQLEYKKVKRNRIVHYIRKEDKPEKDRTEIEVEGGKNEEVAEEEEEEEEEEDDDDEGEEEYKDNEEDDGDGKVEDEDEQ